jgi:hypothetical protein
VDRFGRDPVCVARAQGFLYLPSDFDDPCIRDNMRMMKALGKPLIRSFPSRSCAREAGPSTPYARERLAIDSVYVQSSFKDAV